MQRKEIVACQYGKVNVMKSSRILMLMVLVFSSVSCAKSDDMRPASANGIEGEWIISQVLSNERWGGVFEWKTYDEDVKVRFTPDGKYFRKFAGEQQFTLIGKYQIVSDQEIEISAADPADTLFSKYRLPYEFGSEGHLILGTGRTETIIKEKFRYGGK